METEELRRGLAPLVERSGLLLVDISAGRSGRKLHIHLLVDRVGRVSVQECARLARDVKDLLDGELLPPGEDYRLEVGSPGVGRPLTSEVDWMRTSGRLLRITLEERELVDVLTGFDEERGLLILAGGEEVPLGTVRRAVEVLEDGSGGVR